MKVRGLRLAAWSVLAFAAACAQIVRAHDSKLDSVINAFVKIEPGQPAHRPRAAVSVQSVKFPVTGVEIDVDNSARRSSERSLRSARTSRSSKMIGRWSRRTRWGDCRCRPIVPSKPTSKPRATLPSGRTRHEHYIDQVTWTPASPIDRLPGSEFAVRTTAGPELGMRSSSRCAICRSAKTAERWLLRPLGTVALNPTWVRAAAGFTGLGIVHILTGYDHLLFLLCLVIPLRGWRQILSVITVFTVAHSFTRWARPSISRHRQMVPPFVETAIAASIVYMALENIMGVSSSGAS